MKNNRILPGSLCLALPTFAAWALLTARANAADPFPPAEAQSAKAAEAIPWSQLGAKAGADYKGDGLAVMPTAEGAHLRCVFQRLEGEATREGLWLTSTASKPASDRFCVAAISISRPPAPGSSAGLELCATKLAPAGTLEVVDKLVRFVRSDVIEEYSVSMDGVRQDFVVLEKPAGKGSLRVEFEVTGAKVESAAYGAQLLLPKSRRKIAYSRLRVTDATSRELPARFDVAASRQSAAEMKTEDGGGLPTRRYAEFAVLVDDTDAVYPLRIDPTFSDANWISMNPSIPGANGSVHAAVMDGLGNLYIGGSFTVAGDMIANHIAKWNGSTWRALGSGMNGSVNALAVSGDDLYAGGAFTNAGGSAVNRNAKWNGSSWSALGSGMNNWVYALAVSGSDLYAGGEFTTAGGGTANYVAKWNGSNWSALGSGMNSNVNALAVSDSGLYAGGGFTTAGGSAANRIAKWNGSSWSTLGSGMDGDVRALAVSGSDLYAGGDFMAAGGSAANRIAKWNGNSWSALGSGMDGTVRALAMSGSAVYAGGLFTTAGSSAVNHIAKWNGSSWSALGSGMDSLLHALAVSGSNLFAGGNFTTAGGKISAFVARAYLDLPTLSIVNSGSDVTVSWPASFGSFALQQNPDAANSSSWSNANYPLTTNGAIKSAIVPLTPTNQFFRLMGH